MNDLNEIFHRAKEQEKQKEAENMLPPMEPKEPAIKDGRMVWDSPKPTPEESPY